MSHHDEYRQWPFLTQEEFELACAFFDQRYIKAKLGPARQAFKIRPQRTLTTGASYIEILKLINPPKDLDDLSLAFQKLGGGTEPTSNQLMEIDENENEDEEELRPGQAINGSGGLPLPPRYSLYSHQPYVVYEIHLHPTYQMPTLWFTLHDLPMNEPAFDLNSIYRHLVPVEYKDRLRSIGAVGGISAAPHPITDVPAFFIHPCQTKEAMENLNCPLNDYLMLWLGLVGGCVGLWVPMEMAQDSNGQ